MRIGTSDRILTLNSFFTPEWFKTMFIQLFSWPTYILTQCGIIFATYQFLHFIVTAIIHVINALQINKVFGKKLGFATILLATSTGLLLKRMVRFFNHNPPDDPENTAKELHVSLPPKPKFKHKRNKSKAQSLNDLTEVDIEGKEETASPLIAIPKQNVNENQITTNIDDTITTQAHTNLNQEAPINTNTLGLQRNYHTAQNQLILMSPNHFNSLIPQIRKSDIHRANQRLNPNNPPPYNDPTMIRY